MNTSDYGTNDPSGQEVEPSTAGASDGRDLGRTFTDRDLYELMVKDMPSVFWASWEYLAPVLKHQVAALANDIWERLT